MSAKKNTSKTNSLLDSKEMKIQFDDSNKRNLEWIKIKNGKTKAEFRIYKNTTKYSISNSPTTSLITAILAHFRESGYTRHVLKNIYGLSVTNIAYEIRLTLQKGNIKE